MSWGPPNWASNSPIQPLLASTMIATQTQNIASICIKKQMHLNFIVHHITPIRFAKVMQTIASTKHQTTPLGMQLDCNYQV